MSSRLAKQTAAAVMGFVLCMSSTVASAATTPPSSISPLMALSAFGTPASASAVRPVVPMSNAATLSMTAAAVQGEYDEADPSIWIIGLGLAAFVALIVLVIMDDDEDGDIDLPGMSPD